MEIASCACAVGSKECGSAAGSTMIGVTATESPPTCVTTSPHTLVEVTTATGAPVAALGAAVPAADGAVPAVDPQAATIAAAHSSTVTRGPPPGDRHDTSPAQLLQLIIIRIW